MLFVGVANTSYAQIQRCSVCGKAVSNCPYKGKHPKCPICGKLKDDCPYKGKHPAKPKEEAGYKVTFSCNVKAPILKIDGTNYGPLANEPYYLKTGSHTITLTAEGYYDLTKTITVNSNNKSFYFSMSSNMLSTSEMNAKADKYYTEKNYTEALKWYQKSADLGNASAQDWLGYFYQKGYGVTQDYSEAVKWYRKSANQGYASGQRDLGYMYYNGYGVTKDYSEAVKWFRKAADQGNAGGQNWLGWMYEYGYGVTQNCETALYWYGKAANQGNTNAKENKENLEKTCTSTSSSTLTTSEMNTKASNYYKEKNYTEALKWYQKSAELGNASAQNWLGFMYEKGQGVTQNYSEALRWYRKSADQGYGNAMANLGRMYYYGYGVTQDNSEAVKWFRKSADTGDRTGQNWLGWMYEYGYGVTKNCQTALYWYGKAANQGNTNAKENKEKLEKKCY